MSFNFSSFTKKYLIEPSQIIMLLIVPTYINIKYGLSSGLICAISIALSYALTSDKFQKISISGLKLELREKMKEADELLKQLRHIAEINGESIITMLAYTKLPMDVQSDFSYIDNQIKKTNILMKNLQIDPKKIRKMNDLWEKICVTKYASHLIKFNLLPEEHKAEGLDIFNLSKIELSSAYINKIQGFLKCHQPCYDTEIFDNLKNFITTGEHKNKEIWANIL